MLAALAPGVARADALPARRADQAGGARARPRGRPAGRRQARVAGPLLPRRHRQERVPGPPRRRCASGPGAIVDRAGRTRRPPPRPAPVHGRPAQGARRRRRPSRSTCSPRTRDANTVTVGTRAELATTEVAVRDAVLHRPGAEVDRVKLRYRTRAARAAASRRAPDGGLALRARRAGRRRRARPGRVPDARRRGRRATASSPADEVPGGDGRRVGDLAARGSSPRTRRRRSARSAGPCSVASGAGGPGSSPVASQTSKRWSDQPVGEEQRAEPLDATRPAARSPRPARRARAPRPARPGASSQAPCGNSQKRRPTGWRCCSTSHTWSSSSGTISAAGGFSTHA